MQKTGNNPKTSPKNNSAGLPLLWFLACFLTCFAPLTAQTESAGNKHSDCHNFITIEGSTNVNEFSFQQMLEDQRSLIRFYPQEGYLSVQIPSKNFEPSNPLMYADFIKLIKAEEHPYITIRFHFNPYEFYPEGQQTETIASEIYVTLAGEEKKYRIPGQVHLCENNMLRIRGDVKINLLDFSLHPPTKFMGMVKVNHEVFVNFGLRIEQTMLTQN